MYSKFKLKCKFDIKAFTGLTYSIADVLTLPIVLHCDLLQPRTLTFDLSAITAKWYLGLQGVGLGIVKNLLVTCSLPPALIVFLQGPWNKIKGDLSF